MTNIKSRLIKKIICIIPARFNSKRFPGKPLVKILGIPMLLRTYNQCLKVVDKKKIFIATDDDKIKNLCLKNNINFIITSKKCLTGTDRVVEVSRKFK
jgi:3-deoxy-manno-octulosonate cytidylyltransferase (CMP-KDO synthetase)